MVVCTGSRVLSGMECAIEEGDEGDMAVAMDGAGVDDSRYLYPVLHSDNIKFANLGKFLVLQAVRSQL